MITRPKFIEFLLTKWPSLISIVKFPIKNHHQLPSPSLFPAYMSSANLISYLGETGLFDLLFNEHYFQLT